VRRGGRERPEPLKTRPRRMNGTRERLEARRDAAAAADDDDGFLLCT
jgi:hypothetical protein